MHAPAAAVDPVCGMAVPVTDAEETAEAAGVLYYFCSAACRSRFEHDPASYQEVNAE
jgi:YHS domain-containing protein